MLTTKDILINKWQKKVSLLKKKLTYLTDLNVLQCAYIPSTSGSMWQQRVKAQKYKPDGKALLNETTFTTQKQKVKDTAKMTTKGKRGRSTSTDFTFFIH